MAPEELRRIAIELLAFLANLRAIPLKSEEEIQKPSAETLSASTKQLISEIDAAVNFAADSDAIANLERRLLTIGAEAIDLCEHYHDVGVARSTEIRMHRVATDLLKATTREVESALDRWRKQFNNAPEEMRFDHSFDDGWHITGDRELYLDFHRISQAFRARARRYQQRGNLERALMDFHQASVFDPLDVDVNDPLVKFTARVLHEAAKLWLNPRSRGKRERIKQAQLFTMTPGYKVIFCAGLVHSCPLTTTGKLQAIQYANRIVNEPSVEVLGDGEAYVYAYDGHDTCIVHIAK